MSTVLVVLLILLGLLIAVCVGWRYAARWFYLPCPWWLSWTLENPYVQTLASSSTLLDRMGLAAGMRLLDVGCGPGRVTIPAAHRVGSTGSVVAMDMQPAMLREVERRAAATGLTNIRTVLAGAGQGQLQRDYFDRALMVAVLGEIPQREQALREVHDALKPGGVLSITEVFPDPHYQSRRAVRRLAERVGYRLGESFGNFFAFTLNFVKPAMRGAASSNFYSSLHTSMSRREVAGCSARRAGRSGSWTTGTIWRSTVRGPSWSSKPSIRQP